MGVVLEVPGPGLLAGYAAALERGWSPDNTRDVSAEQLAALRADPAGFLAGFSDEGGTVTLWDGRVVPKLPGLRRVMVNTADDNAGSRRVIEANGGVLARSFAHPASPGAMELVFWVPTA